VKEANNFEGAMKRLEEIVEQLEKGEIPLEETLSLFEEGVRLSRFCREKLDEAEKRVDILLKDEGGILHQEPFSLGQEEDTPDPEGT
jgi:exodeoxyribonuclease VII small subunit